MPLPVGRTKRQRKLNTKFRFLMAVVTMAESLPRLAALLGLLSFVLTAQKLTFQVEKALFEFEVSLSPSFF